MLPMNNICTIEHSLVHPTLIHTKKSRVSEWDNLFPFRSTSHKGLINDHHANPLLSREIKIGVKHERKLINETDLSLLTGIFE